MARLDGLVDWERRSRTGMRPSVDPMMDLTERLGWPQQRFRCVHVAGTKGKGSVASLVAHALASAGRRTGLYTSPHVQDVRERVRVLACSDLDEPLAVGLELALAAREEALEAGTAGEEATWFDVLTAAAFVVFRDAGVEWAVVECGLGGRLDSTNVISAPFAVLTNVDLEHTAILGSTRAAIAREKAGIIAPGALVVSGVGGSSEAAAVVEEVARERGARLLPVDLPPSLPIEEANVRLAGTLLEHLGIEGLRLGEAERRDARLPGRLERARLGEVPVVLDGAHVPSSLDRVLGELERDPGLQGRPVVVFATGRDKALEPLLKVMQGRVDRIVCTSSGTDLSRSIAELVAAACRLGFVVEEEELPGAALEKASRAARVDGWVLVTGSLHLIGAVRAQMEASPACSRSSPTCS